MGEEKPRLTRTYLAVPAHRERLVCSAAASVGDAVFLDLEDAVPPAEKAAALQAALAALSGLDWGRKTVSVRLNAIDSPFIADEINALAHHPRVDAVIIPKAERVTDIADVGQQVQANFGPRAAPVEIELLIETAFGLVNVETLAQAHPLVTALHLGVGDFAASIGARSSEIGVSPPGYAQVGRAADGYPHTPLDLFAYPMMRLLVAARAFNLRAIDGPCGAYQDATATQAAATKAAAMGFDGKQIIHPAQLVPTRDAFVPSAAELAQADRVLAALDAAERQGQGAVMLDGKMIDAANIRMIQRLRHFADQT
jgi:malyl-CoA/(S)-citramalyl-CoA lyase